MSRGIDEKLSVEERSQLLGDLGLVLHESYIHQNDDITGFFFNGSVDGAHAMIRYDQYNNLIGVVPRKTLQDYVESHRPK